MNLIDTVHVEGFLIDDGEEFGWEEVHQRKDGSTYTLVEAHIISSLLNKLNEEAEKIVRYEDKEWDYDDNDMVIDNVGIQLFFTKDKTSLEQAREFQILDTLGALDGSEGWFGYSEYTILGYCVNKFTVGNHDILEILRSHEEEYCHIVMNVYQ